MTKMHPPLKTHKQTLKTIVKTHFSKMLILWHAFFLRPFSNAPRKKKKNEPLSKNGNCRIGRKTQNQIVRGHLGSGSSIRSIHPEHHGPDGPYRLMALSCDRAIKIANQINDKRCRRGFLFPLLV